MSSAQRPCIVPGAPGGLQSSCTLLGTVGGSRYANAAAPSLARRPAVHRNASLSGTSQQGTCVGLCPAPACTPRLCQHAAEDRSRLIQDPTCVTNTITCQPASLVLSCPGTTGNLEHHGNARIALCDSVIPCFPATSTMQNPGTQARRRPRPQNSVSTLVLLLVGETTNHRRSRAWCHSTPSCMPPRRSLSQGRCSLLEFGRTRAKDRPRTPTARIGYITRCSSVFGPGSHVPDPNARRGPSSLYLSSSNPLTKARAMHAKPYRGFGDAIRPSTVVVSTSLWRCNHWC